MRHRFLIIYNPLAGLKGRRTLDAVITGLERRGASITLQTATSLEEGTRFAKEGAIGGSYSAVVAAGGDSSIRGVATGLLGSSTPLGIIPVGTGNVMAREIGLSFSHTSIVRALLRGPTITIHSTLINQIPFFLMVGIGFDAAIIARLNIALKQRIGRLAYGPALMPLLQSRLPKLDIEIDPGAAGASRHQASWVIVTRVSHYGGSFKIAPKADLQKEGFYAILFQPESRFERLKQLCALPTGRLLETAHVMSIPCRQVKVVSDSPLPFQIDGEVQGETPVNIQLLSANLQLIISSQEQGSMKISG